MKLLHSAIAVSLLSVVCRLAGAAREVLVAARLGVSAETDSFVLAFLFLSVYVNVLSASAGIAFLPQFVRCSGAGASASAHGLYSRCAAAGAVLGLAGGAAFVLGGGWLMRIMTGHTDAAFAEMCAVNLRLLAPLAATTPVVSLWTAVLSARGRPLLPVASPLLSTLVTSACLWLHTPGASGGGRLLTAGVLTGGLLEFSLLAVALRRDGFRVRPLRTGRHPMEGVVLREFLFLALSATTTGAVSLVANGLAVRLGSGSAASLGYAARIPSLLTPLGVTLMSAVFLPHFSRLASAARWETLRHSFQRCTAASFAVSVPFTALLLLASPVLVQVLYERGTFTPADTAVVQHLQSLYLLQIPFILPGLLGTRILMTLGENRLVLAVTGVGAVLAVGFCTTLVSFMGLGGISLSASLTQALTGTASAVLAWRQLAANNRKNARNCETTPDSGPLSALKEAEA